MSDTAKEIEFQTHYVSDKRKRTEAIYPDGHRQWVSRPHHSALKCLKEARAWKKAQVLDAN